MSTRYLLTLVQETSRLVPISARRISKYLHFLHTDSIKCPLVNLNLYSAFKKGKINTTSIEHNK